MKKPNTKRIFEIVFVALLLVLMIYLYYVIAKEIGLDFVHQLKAKDYDGAREQLRDLGLKGAFCIVAIEMLQMLVIFAPQEFIMICGGLAFPWYLGIPICVAGIFLGSSLIFVIVRLLHIRLEVFERGESKVNEFIRHLNRRTSITLMVYLMFVMPILPIGAIAYFAASSKISYRRFAVICTTGVIPDVLSAYVIGHVMYSQLGTGYFVPALLVILLLVGLLLFVMINLIKLFFFRKQTEQPNFLLYHVLYFFANLYLGAKVKAVKTDKRVKPKRPFIVLGAHTTFYDFYYMAKAVYPKRLNMVVNRYYTRARATRKILKYLNVIPKRLFTVDPETARGMLDAKANRCNLGIFPEGRLSSSGAGYPYAENTASLLQKLGVDVYYYYSVGGYYSCPKWRGSICKNRVEIHLEKLFDAAELGTLTREQINDRIKAAMVYDDCERYKEITKFPRNAAYSVLGLEKVLFHCPECGSDYTLSSTETALTCSACGKKYEFDRYYTADGMTVADMYRKQYDYRAALPYEISDSCEVHKLTKPERKMTRCGEGTIAISDGKISYTGTVDEKEVTFTHTPDTMPALAYSCGEEIEFYHDGELYYFYPMRRERCVEWSMIWDIISDKHRNHGDEPHDSIEEKDHGAK